MGYDSFNVTLTDKQKIHAVAVFVNYKYLLRAASISNQLKGFNKTVGMNWQVIDDGKIINSKISFNNFNKSYDIYIGKKYLNLKRNGPKFLINHNGSSSELLVFSKKHAELNEIMIPRKKEDLSKLLLAPMPGLLVSLLVKEKQIVDENQPLAIIEAMKMENIIRS